MQFRTSTVLTAVGLVLAALLPAGADAVQLRSTAIAAAGNAGTDASGGIRLGFTIGQPLTGLSLSASQREIVGFWGSGAGATTVSVADPSDAPSLPRVSALRPNAPNPFNPATTLRFAIGTDSGPLTHARLDLFDAQGRHVANLLDSPVEPGHHELAWDGRDAVGRRAASGVYFARLVAGDFAQTIRMTLIK